MSLSEHQECQLVQTLTTLARALDDTTRIVRAVIGKMNARFERAGNTEKPRDADNRTESGRAQRTDKRG